MRIRLLKSMFAIIIFSSVMAAAARAVEVPDGVETNCARGEFGKNKYVDLKLAVVEEWLDASGGGEIPVAAVDLEFREPTGGDQPEKIETAFMVIDSDFNQLSPVIGGGVRSGGTVVFKWNGNDQNGEKVKDGAYRVLMNIKGERYGNLLLGAVFPLNVATAPPVAENPAISSRKATLEYGGAPALTFSTTGIGIAEVVESDAEGNAVSRWEGLVPSGKHTLRSDLTDANGAPFKPGEYTTRVVVRNALGESETLTFEYELIAPQPLKAGVKLNAPANLEVRDGDVVPFAVTLNQPAYVELRHVADNGKIDFVGESVAGEEAILLPKGTSEFVWRRVDTDKFEFYETGAHWINAVVRSLSGEKIAIDSNRVALAPAPKPPAPKKSASPSPASQPKRGVPNLKLTLTPEHVVIGGGRMIVKASYSFDQDSMMTLRVYDKRGKLVKTLVNSRNEHIDKGSYGKELDVEDFDYGAYKIVLEAINFYGKRTASKSFSVGWR